MSAPDARSSHTRRPSRRLTRRHWLLQMGILGAGGLLTATIASPAAAASAVITESSSPSAASLPAAPAATVRKAPVLQMRGGTIT
jgi:hypothetical protein